MFNFTNFFSEEYDSKFVPVVGEKLLLLRREEVCEIPVFLIIKTQRRSFHMQRNLSQSKTR